MTEVTKFSSSSIEVSNLFNQTSQIWKLIEWPDFVGSQMFFDEIVECLSKAVCKYATQVKENNQQIGQLLQSSTNLSMQNISSNKLTIKPGSPLDQYQKLIITTNNLEKVRESLKTFLNDLEFYKYQAIAEKQDRLKQFEVSKAQLETLLNNSSEFIIQIIEQTLETIICNKVSLYNNTITIVLKLRISTSI